MKGPLIQMGRARVRDWFLPTTHGEVQDSGTAAAGSLSPVLCHHNLIAFFHKVFKLFSSLTCPILYHPATCLQQLDQKECHDRSLMAKGTACQDFATHINFLPAASKQNKNNQFPNSLIFFKHLFL